MKALPPLFAAIGVLLLVGLLFQYTKTAELQSNLVTLAKDRDQMRGEMRKLQTRLTERQTEAAPAASRSAEVKSAKESPVAPTPVEEPVATPGVTITAPEGWAKNGRNADKYVVGVDTLQTWGGMPSAYVKSHGAPPDGFCGMAQTTAADNFAGKRIRLNAWIKTEDANDGGGRLWFRVDGKERSQVLAFDNMDNRPVMGSRDWQEASVVLDVPDGAAALAYGFFVQGRGKVWVSGQTLQEVGPDVPSTNLLKPRSAPPKNPVNLGFNPGTSR